MGVSRVGRVRVCSLIGLFLVLVVAAGPILVASQRPAAFFLRASDFATAPGFVAVATVRSTASPQTISLQVPAGGAAVVFSDGNGIGSPTATDDAGNTYSLHQSSSSSFWATGALASKSATTLTVTWGSATTFDSIAVAYSGVGAFGQKNGQTGGTTTLAWTVATGAVIATEIFGEVLQANVVANLNTDVGTTWRQLPTYNPDPSIFLGAGDSSVTSYPAFGLTLGSSWTLSTSAQGVLVELLPPNVISRKDAQAGASTGAPSTAINAVAAAGDTIVTFAQTDPAISTTMSSTNGDSFTRQWNSQGRTIFTATSKGSNPTLTYSFSNSQPFNVAEFVFSNVVGVGGSSEGLGGPGTIMGASVSSSNGFDAVVFIGGTRSSNVNSAVCTSPSSGQLTVSAAAAVGHLFCGGENSLGSAGSVVWSMTASQSLNDWEVWGIDLVSSFVATPRPPGGGSPPPANPCPDVLSCLWQNQILPITNVLIVNLCNLWILIFLAGLAVAAAWGRAYARRQGGGARRAAPRKEAGR